jgi:hypothetical protein
VLRMLNFLGLYCHVGKSVSMSGNNKVISGNNNASICQFVEQIALKGWRGTYLETWASQRNFKAKDGCNGNDTELEWRLYVNVIFYGQTPTN